MNRQTLKNKEPTISAAMELGKYESNVTDEDKEPSASTALGFKISTVNHMVGLTINGDEPAMRELLQQHQFEDMSFVNEKEEAHGNVCLHIASSKGNVALVRTLLEFNADPNLQDMYGNAALHYACDKSRKEVADLLILKGANVHLPDNRGNVPLHHACVADSLVMVNLLLKAGAVGDVLDNALIKPADKTNNPSIKAVIENTLRARKDGGESQGKEAVNWMGFGIGLGVGIGLAMAQQQQAALDEKLAVIRAKNREEDKF